LNRPSASYSVVLNLHPSAAATAAAAAATHLGTLLCRSAWMPAAGMPCTAHGLSGRLCNPAKAKSTLLSKLVVKRMGTVRGWTASPNCCGALPRKVNTHSCLRPAHSWSAQLTLQHGGCLVCAPQVFLSGAPLSSSYDLFLRLKGVANVQLPEVSGMARTSGARSKP
jgi:hypothetical protein